ncbi:MAG: hypothetical protein DCF22_02300 [Leptolyngbya sp.]|nr:MAG: hypothetical protein DCF22_02300 [Leptolyngbya sp.]
MSEEFISAYEIIRRELKDFACTDPNAPDLVWDVESWCIPVESHHFPAPSLVPFVLNKVCGFSFGNPGDKTHWVVPFKYQSVPCAISLEKSGIFLYVSEEQKNYVNPSVIIDKLRKAIKEAERKILAKIAREQVDTANITVVNQFNHFQSTYAYFRQRAAASYKLGKIKNSTDIRAWENLSLYFRANSEGSCNSLAMIDTFFSRLEHFFVLALAFSSFDREGDRISTFVGSVWSEKWKRVLPLTNGKSQYFYTKLVEVKEKYRNTFAHGGFEKKGASFYFHLPEIGAIPVSMSGFRDSVHFGLFPIGEDVYQDICGLLDDFDSWLKDEALPIAWQFAESSLNLRFDQEYINQLHAVSDTKEAFKVWLERERYHEDMHSFN